MPGTFLIIALMLHDLSPHVPKIAIDVRCKSINAPMGRPYWLRAQELSMFNTFAD